MITVNILGCCILRDIFRINEDSKDKYTVKKFVQFSNPISMLDEKGIDIFEKDFEEYSWSGFVKRCVSFDNNKTIFDTIKNNKTDYILLDLCELRFANILIRKNDNEAYYVTNTKFTKEYLSDKEFIKKHNIRDVEEEVFFADEELYSFLLRYAAKIKEIYAEEEIIIVENLPSNQYINYQEKKIANFKYIDYYNPFHFQKIYNMFEKMLPKAKIIKIPNNFLGSTNHMWGKDPLHYVDEYYKYLYEAFETYVCGGNEKDLKKIYDKYLINNEKFEEDIYVDFYIKKTSNNLLKDENFSQGDKFWKVSKSAKSSFDTLNHKLSTQTEDKPYCILFQDLDMTDYYGQDITISIKYKTLKMSTLYVHLRKVEEIDGKKICDYTFLKGYNSYGNTQISSFNVKIPETEKKNVKWSLFVYINQPNSEAYIYRAKLEKGLISSLLK